ncbi:MAG TPA: hypothetical protein VF584_16600 [Longimicrobium sp.]|jgi:hypothetical protein
MPTCISAQTLVNPVVGVRSAEPDAAVPRVPFQIDRIQVAAANAAPLVGRKAGGENDVVALHQAARDYAHDYPAEFRTALDRAGTDPAQARVRANRANAEDLPYVAVALALAAENPVDAAEHRLKAGEENSGRVAALQRELREHLRSARIALAGNPFWIFASGSVTEGLGKAETDDDDGQKPIGTGALGLSLQTPKARYTTRVSLISADNIQDSDIGPAVLTPGAGNALSAALLDMRLNSTPRIAGRGMPTIHLPSHYYVTASSLRLRDGTAADADIVRTTVLGAGALWSSEIAAGAIQQTEVDLRFDWGPSVRWINGDLERAQNLDDTADGIHTGLEAGFSMSFGRVTAASQLYYLWPLRGADEIDGLNGLQLVAGISVTGEFFRGTLNR